MARRVAAHAAVVVVLVEVPVAVVEVPAVAVEALVAAAAVDVARVVVADVAAQVVVDAGRVDPVADAVVRAETVHSQQAAVTVAAAAPMHARSSRNANRAIS